MIDSKIYTSVKIAATLPDGDGGFESCPKRG